MKHFYIFGMSCSLVGFGIACFSLIKPYWEWEVSDNRMFMPFVSLLFIINVILFIQYLVLWKDETKRDKMLKSAFGCNILYWLGVSAPLLIQCGKVLFLK